MNFRLSSPSSLRNFVLLAPPDVQQEDRFQHLWRSTQIYTKLLTEMQRLRGSIYLAERAIGTSDLSGDGRHVVDRDEDSWHLLTINERGQILGCARYYRVARLSRFHALNLRRAALAKSRAWEKKVKCCIQSEMSAARGAGYAYIELGGWALAEELRGTVAALRTVIATYAWCQHMGGALGVCTATERNGSASILRRMGGRSLEWEGAEVPPYHDEQYGCNMEMLRFDSREPNPKYKQQIDQLRADLPRIPVVCRESPGLWRNLAARLPSRLPGWTDELLAGFA
jgi:hypothetical protein